MPRIPYQFANPGAIGFRASIDGQLAEITLRPGGGELEQNEYDAIANMTSVKDLTEAGVLQFSLPTPPAMPPKK